MKIVSKLLLYYSTLIVAIMFVVGIVTSKSNDMLLVHIVFFPVLLYFVYSILKKNKQIDLSEKKFELSTALLLLVGLVFLSVLNINVNKDNKSVETQHVSDSPLIISRNNSNVENLQSEEESEIRQLVVKLEDPDSYVNIRKESTINSEVVDQALPYDEYVIVDETEGWFSILIDNQGTTGWINKDFVLEK